MHILTTTITTTASASAGLTSYSMTITTIQSDEGKKNHEVNEMIQSLPKAKGWRTPYLYFYKGFWCQPKEIQSTINFQNHFQPKNSDLILSTIPKSGTTWLKALVFAIVNRNHFSTNSKAHPLLTSNPHDLVPFFEYKLYTNNQIPDLSNLPNPRIFATHIPYSWFPNTLLKSKCKIVYLCRNPFDTFVSSWHFLMKIKPENVAAMDLEEGLDMFCNGVMGFGPFWDHMLRYWKESMENPQQVLFLKYEDMKEDIGFELKRLAKFLGFPFSMEEERKGVIDEIEYLCSFEKMKELEVNKSGKSIMNFENKNLFRKGEVGDWDNYFTPLMVEKLKKVIMEKLGNSGLTFKMF